ncbi:MAG: polyphosphate glucokinase [Pseudonocardiales bacterium]|jgi:polyphosphate glucokinase|nr:polyphosphate glucokinase [Pseudonocardiales bacterium]
MTVLGIDIGGSGIKGAPVDVEAGALADERYRLETPRPATPDAVVSVLGDVASHWKGNDPLGVTFPGVVRSGVIGTAANLHPDWVGVDAAALFTEHTGRRVTVLNDADAAGVAEVAFGAGRNVRGVVLLITFGTGIGSALFLDGRLVPNTEFGHIELNGEDAELHAADRIREEKDLSWGHWAERVQDYLQVVERLLAPDLIILGGGVSKKADRFLPHVKIGVPIVPAVLQNNAGIVGAAMATTGRY